jgi:hypothetical protein
VQRRHPFDVGTKWNFRRSWPSSIEFLFVQTEFSGGCHEGAFRAVAFDVPRRAGLHDMRIARQHRRFEQSAQRR